MWVADIGTGTIYALEPSDYGGFEPPPCDPESDDSDNDGYTNADEALNSTDPCNPSSKPEDFDATSSPTGWTPMTTATSSRTRSTRSPATRPTG
jgi:hypothetical protein